MSQWTHVRGVIEVKTWAWSKRTKSIVQKILDSAPQITGSECNCDMFVNLPSGHNCGEGAYDKKLDEYVTKEYQTTALITIRGDLRDRSMEQTEAEYRAFLAYLKGHEDIDVGIRNVIIISTYGDRIFTDVSISDEEEVA
jgi:hypothetical protein